jgi:putative CocE/NonD family hydrolase
MDRRPRSLSTGNYQSLSVRLSEQVCMSTLRSRTIALVALIVCSAPAVASTPADAEKPVDLAWGVKIPMRDGVKLSATFYKPAKAGEALPVIFTMTPYISDTYHDRAMYFARNGYVFALVDVRGRGNSGGEFEPFANDPRDGHDVVEWLAKQPWCSGKVAMWGGSYAGFNQWATLKEFPPHLATIVPAAAAHPGVDFPAPHNVFLSYDVQWLTYTSGVTPNTKLFGESSFWIDKYRERYLNHIPFQKLDVIVGNPSPHFQKWLRHRAPDEYLDAMVPKTDDYSRMDIPILTITGHYDDDQPGAMTFYRRHMKYGLDKGRERHYLLMGPWDHAGTRTPTPEVGGLKFGKACLLDLNQLHREWYDWTMKGGARPKFLEKRVAYYVAGAEAWKHADSLEAIPAKAERLYLASMHGAATDAFHSGTLSHTKPGKSPPARYVYDPLDVRPADREREPTKNEVTDQGHALNLFGNGLVFHSEPLREAAEITGYLKFVAWIALDVPDTDFAVKVYEVKPDGSSVALADDRKRARYRESLRKEKLVTKGAIERYEFDSFNFFSRRLEKGSRLRVVFSSPNSIYLEKNYNSGGEVALESREDARTAHVALYHDDEHASYLEVPIIRASSDKMFDVLIRGGTVYDGSGKPPRRADVGVRADRIVAVEDLAGATAKDVVDANGLAVAPGFINMLSWSTDSLLADGRGQSEIRQGVTTQIMGEGNSWGPVNPAIKKRMKDEQIDIKYDIEWTALSDYLYFLERKGVSQNVASFLGATTVREYVLGLGNKKPSAGELQRMCQLVDREMRNGALGIASALEYAPAYYADTSELIALCKAAARHKGKYITHMRSEGERLLEGIDEAICISREAEIPTEIYHFKAAGKNNWNKMDAAIARVEAARRAGLAITADMYCYTAGAAPLTACIPPWAMEGGEIAMRRRLSDRASSKRIIADIRDKTDWPNFYRNAGSPENILLISFKQDSLKPLQGKNLAQIARGRGKDPVETLLDLLALDQSGIGTAYFITAEDNIRKLVPLPWISFGSDEAAQSPDGIFLKSMPHPRAYGNFARLLGKYVREEKLLSLEEAIRRLTHLPATNLGLLGRGLLQEGYFADVVVFDPNTIADRATYEKPHKYAVGMRHVLVNGVQVLKDGEHTGAKPGRALWGPGKVER